MFALKTNCIAESSLMHLFDSENCKCLTIFNVVDQSSPRIPVQWEHIPSLIRSRTGWALSYKTMYFVLSTGASCCCLLFKGVRERSTLFLARH